jgi:hypothetical protein
MFKLLTSEVRCHKMETWVEVCRVSDTGQGHKESSMTKIQLKITMKLGAKKGDVFV